MTLDQLVQPLERRIGILEKRGNQHVVISDITDDSRAVGPGSLFVAVKGERADGHDFLESTLKQRVGAIITQQASTIDAVPTVRVSDSRAALGLLASRFYGDPTSRLRVIGVTGTNGKTTTTYICKSLLESTGRQTGLIGTVAYMVGEHVIPATHTTPGAIELQRLFGRMAQAGMDEVVMEVSSHALALDRTGGVEFDVAVFTNLTQDHLDFHADMDDYFRAKLRLFTGMNTQGAKGTNKRAIVNRDDPRGAVIAASSPVPVWTYGLHAGADINAREVRLSAGGTSFLLHTPAGTGRVESRLVGEHNVYNILAAIGAVLHEGLTLDQILNGIAKVTKVPGRFERVEAGQNFTVVVDYAHTEDALVRLLTAAQALQAGRLITVFGCGGDRDRTKRPKMGRAAVQYSDVVVLTSDNPRTEDPDAILDEVEVGVKEALTQRPRVTYTKIADRRAAIERAIADARIGDIVLIAGKGHEDYQIIGTKKVHFDDREVAQEAIRTHHRPG